MAAVVAAAVVLGSLGTLAGMALAGVPSHWWSAAVLIATVVGGGCAAVIAMPVIDMADSLSGALRALEATTRTDHVTGLLARRAFFDDIARTHDDDTVVVAVIDIDHFKAVNDRHGHAAGDAVLCDVGEALVRALPGASIGRIGGDEFAVCIAGQDTSGVDDTLRRVLTRVETRHVGHISCTHGVAGRHPGETLADCLKRADLALIAAKTERPASVRGVARHAGDHEPVPAP
jgi:diguanylate cyclase (GGDEF)-like protein